jgi:uncharacterized phiE125 gp8 family phage protein
MLSPVRVTAPVATPVSLDEIKAFLRIDHADDDELLTTLIQAATDHFDGWSGILGRALVTQSWRVDLWCWPVSRDLTLPLLPVQSITSVVYSDSDNADQSFAAGNYQLYAGPIGPFLRLGDGVAWPLVYTKPDAVRVTFVAGYGAPAAVPEAIKLAIKFHVENAYDGHDDARERAMYSLVEPFRARRI